MRSSWVSNPTIKKPAVCQRQLIVMPQTIRVIKKQVPVETAEIPFNPVIKSDAELSLEWGIGRDHEQIERARADKALSALASFLSR